MSDANDGAPLSEAARAAGRARHVAVQARIVAAAERAGRDPGTVTLVGVAKRQPLDRILAAVDAGLRVIGQSYIQEARDVRPRVERALAAAAPLTPSSEAARPDAAPALSWRMVGRLQRNKAGLAARLFDAVESIDRPELIETLARRAGSEGRRLDVLLQVSLCGEPQKGGCEPEDVAALARQARALPELRLAGLMTVPAASPDAEASRPVFRRLHGLRAQLADEIPELADGALSMGMSGDFEVAIEEGATLVRVGTALFGERTAR